MSTLRRLVKEDEALYLQWSFTEDHFLMHLAGLLSKRALHVCSPDIEEAASSSYNFYPSTKAKGLLAVKHTMIGDSNDSGIRFAYDLIG